jgi:hypothetical protein
MRDVSKGTMRCYLVSKGMRKTADVTGGKPITKYPRKVLLPITIFLIQKANALSPKSVQSDSKMGTEVVGVLTHADAPQQGNIPRTALITIHKYEIILCGCYACGPIPRS